MHDKYGAHHAGKYGHLLGSYGNHGHGYTHHAAPYHAHGHHHYPGHFEGLHGHNGYAAASAPSAIQIAPVGPHVGVLYQ